MRSPNFDWNEIFEFTWRILLFLVAIAIIITTHVMDSPGALERGRLVLAAAVRLAATTQAVIDGFVAIAVLAVVTLLIVVLRSHAPEGPASPLPLFPVRRAAGRAPP